MAAITPITGAKSVVGRCVCSAIQLEFDFPAFWAWHDHSKASQHAHGAAYTTYVGVWRSRFRIIAGEDCITEYVDKAAGTARSFCARCGTPVLYDRGASNKMVNIPRALFRNRTGREPRYHIGMDEAPDWAYAGEALGPLKGFPGVLWARPKKQRRAAVVDFPDEEFG